MSLAAAKRPQADPKELIPSINEAAKGIGLQWLTLLLTGCYIGISAAEVTDQAFLFRDQTSLPVIDVKIGVDKFFILSPLLLVILHLAMLGKEYVLLLRLSWLPGDPATVNISRFEGALSLGRHFSGQVGWLLAFLQHLVFWVMGILFPPLLLMHLQMSSLRYRDPFITKWITWWILVDLVAVMVFLLASWFTKKGNPGLWEAHSKGCGCSPIQAFLSLAALAGALMFLNSYASFLQRDVGCRRAPDRFLGFYSVRRYLILNQGALAAKIPEIKPSGSKSRARSPQEWSGNGMSFRGRDLRCADFSDAPLRNADFRGAVLSGAIFDGADLRNAVFAGPMFNNKALRWEELDRPANLEGASFERADLTRARLMDTNLRNAGFESALLQEADLSGADLSNSRAFRARMLGVKLMGASLRGADFRSARLPHADLSEAWLELSRFDGAQLDGALFNDANVEGADFRNARMRGVNGLSLRAINLRGARIWALNACAAKDRTFPLLVDFRAVNFEPVEWEALAGALRFRAVGRLLPETRRKIRKPPGATCISAHPLSGATAQIQEKVFQEQLLLYDAPKASPGAATPLQEWPEGGSITEEAFYRKLSERLIERACREQSGEIDGPAGVEPLVVSIARRADEDADLFGGLLKEELPNAACKIEIAPESHIASRSTALGSTHSD